MRGTVPALLAATLLFDACTASGAAPGQQTLTRHFTPDDRIAGRYQYVPFEVPRGTTRLNVTYTYEKANGDNVVDLGVFQPGPLEIGTGAFRGYSGGARNAFTISAVDATPGYISGPIPAGTWHILLGLYKVGTAGVDVTLTIDAGTDPQTSSRPEPASAARPPAPNSAAWYSGALHTHTLHSDGTITPSELMERFRTAKFDFVAITDHNNTTHSSEAVLHTQQSPLWIIGEEVTTPAGHASVWGLAKGDWIDFRVGKGDPRINDLVAAAHARGALFSINHPVSECVGCGWEHDIVKGVDAIEIANGRHGEVARAIARWDAVLQTGRRLTAVGSSDWHSVPAPIDVAHSRVYASALTQDAILRGIRDGRVIVMLRSGDVTPDIQIRAGDRRATIGDSVKLSGWTGATVAINAPSMPNGQVVIVNNGRPGKAVALDGRGQLQTRIDADAGYTRFEVLAADGTLVAVTNPIYVEQP